MNTIIDPSFVAASKDESGKIYVDRFEDGLRFIIRRGPSSINAYIGVPTVHPLAGHSYNDLPIRAHGGLTFSGEGKDGNRFPAGFWWYGWDYSHCDDLCFYDLKDGDYSKSDKAWTVEEIEKDSWETLYDFKALLKLSEAIAVKSMFYTNLPRSKMR